MKRVLKIGCSLLLLTIIVMTQTIASCDVRASEASEQRLDIDVEAVFNVHAKTNRTFPVKMTIHNPGPAMSGELVVEIAGRETSGNLALAKTVHLPQNGMKEVWFALPGMSYSPKNNRIIFYKDTISDQNIIPFQQGQMYVNTSAIPDFTRQIGILSSQRQVLNFLNLLNESSIQFSLIHLNEASLPDEAYLLHSLDYIVINDFDTSVLTAKQIDAIKAWVEQGGQLILAGGSSFAKGATPFSDMLQIELKGTRMLHELTAFEHIAERELVLTHPIDISVAHFSGGEHIIVEHDIPIMTMRNIQRGAVLYVAYDLSQEPLASWGGNIAIWDRVFHYDDTEYEPSMLDLWHVTHALDYFSELVPPPLGLLLLFFIGYIILIAPALYYVLKKRDKREYAWFIIPAIALMTSISIYVFGAADRSQTLVQTLGIIDLNEEGQGLRTSYTSVFVPKGGEYTIELGEGMQAQVLSANLHGHNTLTGQFEQVQFLDDDQQRIQFSHVPYWSTRKFAAIDRSARQYGQLDYELVVTDSGIQGEVHNLTGEQLKHVLFIHGDQYIVIDELLPDASATFQFSYHSSPHFTGHYYGSELQSQFNLQALTRHEEALLREMINMVHQSGMAHQTYFIALSESIDETLSIDNRAVLNKQTHLWRLQVNDVVEEEAGR